MLDGAYAIADADLAVQECWTAAWRTVTPCLPSQWAQAHRIVTSQASSEPGDWDNARTPYLVEIMDCFSPDHPAEFIILRKPTQWGGTEVIVNCVGWCMSEREPCAMALVVPGLGMAKRHMRQRFGPSIAACKVWSEAVSKERSRDAANSMFEKEFQSSAGILFVLTANSSEGLRAMPLCIIVGDEISKWKRNLDGEGSAWEQVVARTDAYQGMRKILGVSSPTIEGVCLVSELLEEKTDWREHHVPCPHCGELHMLQFENLQPDGTMMCPVCHAIYGEESKTAMLAGSRWIARCPGRDPRWVGFDSNALYIPIRMGDSWADLAKQLAEAQEKPEKMVRFTQQKMGKPFKGARERQEFEVLKKRAEPGLMLGRVPDGYYILTLGVDFQADRAEGQVIAWGPGEKGVTVDYWVVDCDPTDPNGYDAVDAAMRKQYRKGAGYLIATNCALDGGNWTESVAGFVRDRQRRLVACGDGHVEQRVVLCRGRSAPSPRIVHRPAKSETNSRGKTLTVATAVGCWGVGTGAAKTVLFQRIGGDERRTEPLERFLRFPGGVKRGQEQVGGLTDHYYKGLTAEYWDHALGEWVHDKSIRNEPTDTLVYAYFAALHPHVRLDLMTEAAWRALQQRLEPPADLLSPVAVADPEEFEPVPLPGPVTPPPAPKPSRVDDDTPDPFGSSAWSGRL